MGNTFQDFKVYSAFSSSCFLTAKKTNDRKHNTPSTCRATKASTHTKKLLIKNHLHYWKAEYTSFHLISQSASGNTEAKCQANIFPLLPQADLSVVISFPICSQLLFSPFRLTSVKETRLTSLLEMQRQDQCLEGNPWLESRGWDGCLTPSTMTSKKKLCGINTGIISRGCGRAGLSLLQDI